MNRQRAIQYLNALAEYFDDQNLRFIAGDTREVVSALCAPVPDPKTGLVPCGCGGQVVFEGSFLDEEVPSSYRVSLSCIECGISTIAYEYEQEAMKAWNTAMGWKGDAG